MRFRIDGAAPGPALRLAASLDAVLLDARGCTADAAGGRGPDARDVLAGRATVPESLRTVAGVPVVGWGGPLRSSEVDRLATLVEQEPGRVVVFAARERSGRDA